MTTDWEEYVASLDEPDDMKERLLDREWLRRASDYIQFWKIVHRERGLDV